MVFAKSLFKTFILLLAIVVIITSTACHSEDSANTIKVGTIAGPETELMEVAKGVAQKKYGVSIKIIEFTDYVMPNAALEEGSIDANVYQHLPYLQDTLKQRGYKLIAIGKTFVYPMGIYSKKIKNLSELNNSAIVAIPNDPSNEARALLLLEKAGLLRLKPDVGIHATKSDIIDNPKKLRIKELDAAQLPRVLPDVDLAVINTNYAMLAGLLPNRDALFIESANSPYANLIVVRDADKDNPKLRALVESLHSIEVVSKANVLFKGQAIPAWDLKY